MKSAFRSGSVTLVLALGLLSACRRADDTAGAPTADSGAGAPTVEVVRAAQQRGASATTPEERAQARQPQWEDQTAPEGARTVGMPAERYRAVRATVTRALETLDFQGKIESPKSIDQERASPETRERVARDPFTELSPGSAAAIRARMDRLVPLWVQYVNLTAVAG